MDFEEREEREEKRRAKKIRPQDLIEQERCSASVRCNAYCSRHSNRETCPAYYRIKEGRITFEGTPMEEKKVKK